MTTISAGQVPRKPTRWEDLTLVTRVLQSDGSEAEACIAMLYASNGLPWPGVALQSAGFSVSGSTSTVVSAIASNVICVYAVKLICTDVTDVSWLSGAAAIEPAQRIVAGGGYVESVDPPSFLFQTVTSSDNLRLSASGAGTASGRVSYFTVAGL